MPKRKSTEVGKQSSATVDLKTDQPISTPKLQSAWHAMMWTLQHRILDVYNVFQPKYFWSMTMNIEEGNYIGPAVSLALDPKTMKATWSGTAQHANGHAYKITLIWDYFTDPRDADQTFNIAHDLTKLIFKHHDYPDALLSDTQATLEHSMKIPYYLNNPKFSVTLERDNVVTFSAARAPNAAQAAVDAYLLSSGGDMVNHTRVIASFSRFIGLQQTSTEFMVTANDTHSNCRPALVTVGRL